MDKQKIEQSVAAFFAALSAKDGLASSTFSISMPQEWLARQDEHG